MTEPESYIIEVFKNGKSLLKVTCDNATDFLGKKQTIEKAFPVDEHTRIAAYSLTRKEITA